MNWTNFIIQTLARIQAKSPAYFLKLRRIAGVLAVITLSLAYLPDVLQFLSVDVVFAPWLLKLILISGKIYPMLGAAFGFTWLPADWEKTAKYKIDQQVFVKATSVQVIINSVSYEDITDTKTGRKEKNIIYSCNDGNTYYEPQLTS